MTIFFALERAPLFASNIKSSKTYSSPLLNGVWPLVNLGLGILPLCALMVCERQGMNVFP